MERIIEVAPNEPSLRAILVGGPTSLPAGSRIQAVSHGSDKIKVEHRGGYEHFERQGAPDAAGVPEEIQFHWTMRTNVAE
jgi:hypothetical protein